MIYRETYVPLDIKNVNHRYVTTALLVHVPN